MSVVSSAIQTIALKRLSAAEIIFFGSGLRFAIGISTTRKKKNPPIIKTTEPTCTHCIKGLINILKVF
ncbi:hypothetical protein F4225_10285 [Candidatus Poribacteria bacterium]|nr:hypothetical protein [Candidatus Poribacteria bacterium]